MNTLVEQGKAPMKLWTGDMLVEPQAMQQIRNIAALPIVGPHVAIMPDVHFGIGATVGSVIPTRGAIIPAAVGVDIGCGMAAVRTPVRLGALDGKISTLRTAIEDAIPVGGPGVPGSWGERRFGNDVPRPIRDAYDRNQFPAELVRRHPGILRHPPQMQLGTLGGGNHFIEVCRNLDGSDDAVWIMLHSGSRGIGNRIGTYFIERAKEAMLLGDHGIPVDSDLAWIDDGTELFKDYWAALTWAQDYARRNRELMLARVLVCLDDVTGRSMDAAALVRAPVMMAVNCHHNYAVKLDDGTYLTRKGAVSARAGELGIIPGSMGAKSFIVRGKGNPESFWSCSHGAGRRMSRGEAKRTLTLADHVAATAGVDCRKDVGVIDESPGAYKDIDAVMAAQSDLVEVVHVLKQIVCVKG